MWPRSRRQLVLATAACTAVAAIGAAGIAAGRAMAPAPSASAQPLSASTAAPPTGTAVPSASGVPHGLPHTSDGALTAAAEIVQVEEGPLVLSPAAYRAAWQAMSTPSYWSTRGRAAAEQVLDAHAAAIADAAAGRPTSIHTWPLTVVRAPEAPTDPDRVVARIWALSVVHIGASTNGVFSSGTVEVAWSGGQWRLDGGTSDVAPGEGSSGAFVISSGTAIPAFLDGGESR